MKAAIVDIGSNTINLDLFSADKGGQVTLDRSYSETVGLIGLIEDGKLSRTGIERLCETIQHYQRISDSGYALYCFATASLRRADNAKEVIDEIYQRTGAAIRRIGEQEEALLSMRAVLYEIGPSQSGMMLDMGGGSTEKVIFQNTDILLARSMPFGSLSLYRQFVRQKIPSRQEANEIAQYVKREFDDGVSSLSDTFYIVGGTGRALCKLHGRLHGRKSDGLYELNVEAMQELCEHLLANDIGDDHDTEKLLTDILPKRKHNFLPGLIALCAMAEQAGAKQAVFPTGNVRKGFLLSIL